MEFAKKRLLAVAPLLFAGLPLPVQDGKTTQNLQSVLKDYAPYQFTAADEQAIDPAHGTRGVCR